MVAHGTEEAVITRLAGVIAEGASDVIAHPVMLDRSSSQRAFEVIAEADRRAGSS